MNTFYLTVMLVLLIAGLARNLNRAIEWPKPPKVQDSRSGPISATIMSVLLLVWTAILLFNTVR